MKHLKKFEKYNNLEYNLKIIKDYISVLENDYFYKGNFSLLFFIILYNLLIIQSSYPEYIKNYNLNEDLDLVPTKDKDEIYNIFLKLYDPNSITRNKIEKFDVSDKFIKYICKKFNIRHKMLSESDIEELKLIKNMNKYNL